MIKVKQPHGGSIILAEKGESGNPNGRPKKVWKQMQDDIVDKYGIEMSDSEIKDIFKIMGKMNADGLKAMAEDRNLPVVVSIYAKALYKESTQSKAEIRIAEVVMDRAIGRPQENRNINLNDKREIISKAELVVNGQ